MTEYTDVMEFGLKPTGEIVVMIGEDHEASSIKELIALAPNASPLNWAVTLNELEFGGSFTVISDPGKYESGYRSQIEAEDPAQAWQVGVIRLRDFGIPDFSQIAAPSLTDDKLVFFASDDTTGLPYRAEAMLKPGFKTPVYTPMELFPASDCANKCED